MPKLSCGKLGGLAGRLHFSPFSTRHDFVFPLYDIGHPSRADARKELKPQSLCRRFTGDGAARRRVFNHSTPSSVARARTEAGTGSRKRETAVSASEAEPR